MLPGVDGFAWDLEHIVFLGAFFTVVAVGSRGVGWFLRVRPAPGGPDTRHLLRSDEARAWNAVEVQRVLLALRDPVLGAALADGSRLATDLPAAAPGHDWQALRGQVLLSP